MRNSSIRKSKLGAYLEFNMGGKKYTAVTLSSVNINLPIPTSAFLLVVRFITPFHVPSALLEPKAPSSAT
jgi:hypothetical protein